jgi:S-DNA-T family DNA segregation ATPase FtsK/SpoIIIE
MGRRTKKRRAQAVKKIETPSVEKHSKLRGVIFSCIGLYLIVAFFLVDFNPLGGAKSFLGEFGFGLASFFKNTFGLSAYILGFGLLILGVQHVRERIFAGSKRVLWLIPIVTSLSVLLSLSNYGGSFGSIVGGFLGSLIGVTGVSILSVMALGIATFKATNFGLASLREILRAIFKFAGWFAGETFSALRTVFRFSNSRTEKPVWEKEIEESLPTPKRRVKGKEEKPEELDLTPTHIVVKKPPQKKKDSLSSQIVKSASYTPPPFELLTEGSDETHTESEEELIRISRVIEGKLRDFNIAGRITEVHPGPVVTMFEFEPAPGIKVGKIAALQDDLSMSLKAQSLRIVAPIPRKGTVGIEVPNRAREIVRLRTLLESEQMRSATSSLTIGLGKDAYGEPVCADIASMPHLLIAGATGTGKSVCINTVLVSLLYRASPEELGLILIDPKILELSVYEGIPHLRVPVVTNPKQARAVLDWATKEMDRRYRMLQKHGVRNIDGYNALVAGTSGAALKKAEDGSIQETLEPLSKLVIVIDELADLMLTVGREIEELITRLAQKARAAGIHLIVATQRPSVDVITGLIKANFPARLSFRVASRIDSRTILDAMGAEKLLGRGDMLFLQPGGGPPRRVHGAFVTDTEVKNVIEAVKKNGPPAYDERIIGAVEKAMEEEGSGGTGYEGSNEYDELYDKAVELVLEKGQASTSMVQRVFRIGYNRAARIIEQMERDGIVGPMDGVKPREVIRDGISSEEPI